MDTIRENLVYKDTDLTICFGNLTVQEQYECIRLILASNRKNINICSHDIENKYLVKLLKDLPVKFTQCWKEETMLQTFDLHK